MNDTASVPAQGNAMSSLADSPATRPQIYAAVAVAGALLLCTLVGASRGFTQGPEIPPLLPITATMWSLADLLTALLLLGQFYFNGRITMAILAVAYALGGLLTWSYLFTFPGLFAFHTLTLAAQGSFAYFWLSAHALFPVLVALAVRPEFARKRIRSRRALIVASIGCVAIPLLVAGALTAAVLAFRDSLPHLVIGGRLQPIDRFFFHPTIVVLNLSACIVLVRVRERTTLQLWLCVAMFSACLDSILVNLSAKVYSYGWYTGKVVAVVTACIVLVMMLGEVVRLYGRQLRLTQKLEQDIADRHRVEAALRASEERFRQVEENAPVGLALIALDGSFIRVNPALCKLTGYGEDELLAMRFQALTHPSDVAENLAHIERAVEGAVDRYELEKRYIHKNGHVVWVSINGSIVRGQTASDASYLIAQIQDISVRKAAEKAVAEAQRSMLAAAEAKSRFLATMSHEIRTPMNGIIGMSELLSLSDLSAEQSEYVRVVWDSGRSLLRVLDDILDYSKIEAGKLELEILDFDLPSQIRSVAALFEPQFVAKGVSLGTHVEPGVPLTLVGDPGRVRQILMNLVANALKFTDEGGSVRIVVSNEAEHGEEPCVRFSVVDTGIGIAPDVRHRLFQPFSQADGSTTRKYGGTGLGLSICKQLVDLMGGRIGVTSNVDCGSSFWFSLPLRLSERTVRVLDAPAREMGERRALARPRPESILIAEDNEVNALLAIKQFKRLGFDITVVTNGQEAVAACAGRRFDVVFMDCQMPIVDGFQATKAIRIAAAGEHRVPIVAMTANASAADRAACHAAGMDGYLAKPVSLTALRAALAQWLPNMTEEGTENSICGIRTA